MKIFHFIGYSGSGKTYVLEKIIKDLSKDFNIAIIKHDAHDKIIDKSLHISEEEYEKDTERYVNAGAYLSFIISKSCVLVEGKDLSEAKKFCENLQRDDNDEYKIFLYILNFIKNLNKKIDLVIVEGFKDLSYNIKDIDILKSIKNIGLKRLENKKDLVFNENFYDIIVSDDKEITHTHKFDFNEIEKLENYLREIIR